jgi:hypothetical protein
LFQNYEFSKQGKITQHDKCNALITLQPPNQDPGDTKREFPGTIFTILGLDKAELWDNPWFL